MDGGIETEASVRVAEIQGGGVGIVAVAVVAAGGGANGSGREHLMEKEE